MILSNYHTHSDFCDGRGQLEEYIISALQKGLTSLGFSSHAPLPFDMKWAMKTEDFPVYATQVSQLKRKYADHLDVFLGLEIDYIPGMLSPTSPEIRRMDLDYTLGSVHLLGQLPDHSWWTVDNSFTDFEAGLHAVFDGNIRQAVEHYYTSVKTMIATSPPDIVGHLDRIKRNNYANQFFSEQEEWYRTLVTTTLDVIEHSDCILEVNTGGLVDTAPAILYPSEWILDECLRRHIPVTVNSDAHSPDGITRYFEEISQQLQHIGFHSIRALTRDGWVDVPV